METTSVREVTDTPRDLVGAAYGTPSKRKNAAFSCFSAGNPLGFVFGTILCGIATQLFNWRASFILLSIIWAVFTVFAFWAVPNVETFERAPLRQRLGALRQFDYVGTVLTILGTGMFSAGLTYVTHLMLLLFVLMSIDSVPRMAGPELM